MYLKLIVLFTLFLNQCTCSAVQIEVELSSGYVGVVIVKINGGAVGSVCKKGWSKVNCQVVCRQLGYSGGYVSDVYKQYPYITVEPFLMTNVTCTGQEEVLGECPYIDMKSSQNDGCNLKFKAGCSCDKPNDDRMIQQTVLQFAEVSLSEGSHGIVEVKRYGDTRVVCDNQWTDTNCQVVCSQIGLSGGSVINEANTKHLNVWLDGVKCEGTEAVIDECKHKIWGHYDCIPSKQMAACQCAKKHVNTTADNQGNQAKSAPSSVLFKALVAFISILVCILLVLVSIFCIMKKYSNEVPLISTIRATSFENQANDSREVDNQNEENEAIYKKFPQSIELKNQDGNNRVTKNNGKYNVTAIASGNQSSDSSILESENDKYRSLDNPSSTPVLFQLQNKSFFNYTTTETTSRISDKSERESHIQEVYSEGDRKVKADEECFLLEKNIPEENVCEYENNWEEDRSIHPITCSSYSREQIESMYPELVPCYTYKYLNDLNGLVVVINMNFEGCETYREWSDNDAKLLCETWRHMRFEVVVKNNLKTNQLISFIGEIQGKLRTGNYGCLVFYIMSHGSFGKVHTYDGEVCIAEDLLHPFSTKRLPEFKGYPKLFFIQACRMYQVSNHIDLGHESSIEEYEERFATLPNLQLGNCHVSTASDGTVPESLYMVQCKAYMHHGENPYDKGPLPPSEDFLIGYACCQGEAAFRIGELNGSIYIVTMCKNLQKKKGETINWIKEMDEIQKEVYKYCKEKPNKQSPIYFSSLTKQLEFKA